MQCTVLLNERINKQNLSQSTITLTKDCKIQNHIFVAGIRLRNSIKVSPQDGKGYAPHDQNYVVQFAVGISIVHRFTHNNTENTYSVTLEQNRSFELHT
jgi:hypothetical protein